jgi:hypothetical protein
MKTWWYGGIAPPFLTPALNGGEWLASRHGLYIFWETAPPGIHWKKRLGWPQSLSGRRGIDGSLLPLPRIETRPSSL